MADSYNASDKGYLRSIKIHSIIRLVICILVAIICLFPFYIIIVNSIRSTTEINKVGFALFPESFNVAENFSKLEDTQMVYPQVISIWMGYVNSLGITLIATVFTVFFSGMTAYGLVVYDFKLRNFATIFILAVMMIPMQVVSTGFLDFMIDIHLTKSWIPLVVPAIAAPSTVFFMLQYMRSSFPLEIVEAARIDGSGEFRTFLQIALPIMKPAFAVQAIFAFVANWNNYYTPSLILIGDVETRTMPMMVASVLSANQGYDLGTNYLVVFMSTIPVIVVYLCLSKFIIKGVALGAVKG